MAEHSLPQLLALWAQLQRDRAADALMALTVHHAANPKKAREELLRQMKHDDAPRTPAANRARMAALINGTAT